MGRKPRDTNGAPSASPDDVGNCFAEYSGLRTKVARAQQEIAAMLKRYEKSGVDKKTIKAMYALAQMEPEEVSAQMAREREYASVLDLIEFDEVGQGGFGAALSAPPRPSDAVAERLREGRAFNDGYNSGKAGGKLESGPFNGSPGSIEFVAWRDGWEDGAADRKLLHPEKANVTTADDRPRRGRGPAGRMTEPLGVD